MMEKHSQQMQSNAYQHEQHENLKIKIINKEFT